jgi:hypothetical protein
MTVSIAGGATTTSAFERRALFLAERGIPCTPLKIDTKQAFLPGWEESATCDLNQIAAWNKLYPNNNVGAVAKAQPGGFWFLELDSADAAVRINREAGEQIPRTLTIRSSPGKGHIYFRHSALSLSKMVNLAQGFVKHNDWSARCDRQYVVAPFSVHPKTKLLYEVKDNAEIVEGPEWLINWLLSQKLDKKTVVDNVAAGPIIEGGRNNTLASIGGKLRHSGFDHDFILAALLDVNEKRCIPPLGEAEVITVADSVSRYDVGHEIPFTINGRPPELSGPRASASAATAPTATENDEPFVTVSGDLFMKEDIPPRKVLIQTISGGEAVFFGPSINQIFAWRGMGKTNLGFGLVAALSRGEKFLNWEAPGRTKVLYVEGELPAAQAQERWKQIVGTTNEYAQLITIDKQPKNMITSLASTAGMARLEKTLAKLESEGFKTEVLFLDSISTLFNAKANDEDTWIAIQSWLISLRSRGIAIFFFHHAGKSGLSRSHSKSEDMLDVSIKLEAPKEPEAGCLHAVMSYDKARAGLSEAPAEIKMRRAHSDACRCKQAVGIFLGRCSGDGVTWEYEPAVNIRKQQAIEMFAEGKSVRAVAKELKFSIGTVNTWRTQWSKEHLLNGITVDGVKLDTVKPVADVNLDAGLPTEEMRVEGATQ